MIETDHSMTHWYPRWYRHLLQSGPRMTDAQMEASARLATVLLCGEQSAIQVFAAEINRRQRRISAASLRQLRAIERDEQFHEHALRAFCRYLPAPGDKNQLKRRAQRFFAGLGRVDDLARHFGQIAHLDGAVCKIMWHVENSELSTIAPLSLLAARIKKDEARHVAAGRRYATGLGLSEEARAEDSERICQGLVDMLGPLGSAFETIGVDSDRLFAHVKKSARP